MRTLCIKRTDVLRVCAVTLALLVICVNAGVARSASATRNAGCDVGSLHTVTEGKTIVVANRIPVAKGHEKAFERRFERRRGAVDKMPGFIRIEILRPLLGEHYIIMTHWESKAAFAAWRQSEAFKRAHAHANPALKEMLAGRVVCEVHEVIQMSEKKP